MSKERTSVFGIVVVTMLATSALLVAGWFGAQKYFAQQTASAPKEEAPAAPAPKKKTRSTKAGTNRGDAAAAAVADATASSAASAAPDAAASRPDNEPFATSAPAAAVSPTEPARAAVQEPASAPVEAAPAPASVDQTDARAIMVESERRRDAKFYRYDGVLQSYDAKDRITEKRWTLDQQGAHGRSKVVVRFTSPPEVKGVALLIYNHPERASDQWMWTPAIERDRRIAMQDRSTRFFGTDFSFEDMEERDVDQFDYSMLGSETIDGAACWKLQSVPKASRTSQYTRSIAWVRKDNYVMVRLDNYVKDDVVRRLTFSSLENISGYWTPKQMEIADLPRKTRTRLSLDRVKYNVPMKDEEFTLQAIRK